LQDAVEKLVFDDGAEEFGDLLQVLLRVAVQETIFIEEAVKHAGVNLLFFHDLRLTEILHCYNQRLNTAVNLVRWSREDVLEVFIGCLVDFISALSRRYLTREENRVLCDQIFDHVLRV